MRRVAAEEERDGKRIVFQWERDLGKKISDATGSRRSTNEFRKIELYSLAGSMGRANV